MKSEDYAKQLRDASASHTTIAPLRNAIGETDMELAYQIQNINTLHRSKAGARLIGKKIGLTSEAVQQQFGITAPDYGMLFNDMEVLNGLSISMSQLMQPRVEAEIAFVLGADLDQDNLTIVDLLDAIDYALPAIEIVGSRIENWNIKITDTIADNASASHFVLGHSPKTLDEFDVIESKMTLFKNGDVVSEGKGADCLGSPLNATLWLANKMVDLGSPLLAGELILSGALGPMVAVTEGDHLLTEIAGLGKVSVSFTA